jgi:hypothetical protein
VKRYGIKNHKLKEIKQKNYFREKPKKQKKKGHPGKNIRGTRNVTILQKEKKPKKKKLKIK